MTYIPPISEERRLLYEPPPLPPAVRLESQSPQGLELEHLGIQSDTQEVVRHFAGEIIHIQQDEYVSVDVPVVTPNETHYEPQTYTLAKDNTYRVVEDAGGYTAEDLMALESVQRGHNLTQEEIALAVAEAARSQTESIYGQPLSETSTYFAPPAETTLCVVEDVIVVNETVEEPVVEEPGENTVDENPGGSQPGQPVEEPV